MALGFQDPYFDIEKKEYNKERIKERIDAIAAKWKEKYPELKFNTDKLKYDTAVTFNQTYTAEVEYLNLETK